MDYYITYNTAEWLETTADRIAQILNTTAITIPINAEVGLRDLKLNLTRTISGLTGFNALRPSSG